MNEDQNENSEFEVELCYEASTELKQNAMVAFPSLSLILKEEFNSKISGFLTKIISILSKMPEINIKDGDMPNSIPNPYFTTASINLQGTNKIISVDMNQIRMMIEASDALFNLVSSMKEKFSPFLSEELLNIVMKCSKFRYNSEVRNLMMECFSYLIDACDTQENKSELMIKFIPYLTENLESNIESENFDDKKSLAAIKSLVDCIEKFTSLDFINEPTINIIINDIIRLCTSNNNIKDKIICEYNYLGEEQTEQDLLEAKEKIDEIAENMSEVVDAVSFIVKTFGSKVTETMSLKIIPIFKESVNKTINTEREKL